MPARLDRRARCTRAPVSRTSSRMVDSATVSAGTGIGGNPSRAATTPSCATPSRARWASCGRSQTDNSKVLAYSIARSSTCVSISGASAWLNAMQPASVSSAISVMPSPFSFLVSAPTGYTRGPGMCLARNLSISTRPGSSSGGSVSGGQANDVTPPTAAACISVSSVAMYSRPGSRRRTDRSTRPGQTIRPLASITWLAWKSRGIWPTPTIWLAAT